VLEKDNNNNNNNKQTNRRTYLNFALLILDIFIIPRLQSRAVEDHRIMKAKKK